MATKRIKAAAIPDDAIRVDVSQGTVWLHNPDSMTTRSWDVVVNEFQVIRDTLDNARAEAWYRSRIAAWDLVDPDRGTRLKDPDRDSFEGVTRGTMKAILAAFTAAVTAPIPKGSSTP